MEAATEEITHGINEMASGAEQINTAITKINELSGNNKESIDSLVAEITKFKVA
jgi:methyl-accepting chemotaxis protein